MSGKAISYGQIWDFAVPKAVDESQRWVLSAMQSHGQELVTMLWRILGNEQDVCDAYQNTFLRLAHYEGRGKPEHIKAYIFRSASNAAISMLRHRAAERRRLSSLGVLTDQCQRAGTTNQDVSSPANELDSKYLQETLRCCIAQLPEHLRNTITLRDLAELSYAQIGRILGISSATARVYRCKAIQLLSVWMNPVRHSQDKKIGISNPVRDSCPAKDTNEAVSNGANKIKMSNGMNKEKEEKKMKTIKSNPVRVPKANPVRVPKAKDSNGANKKCRQIRTWLYKAISSRIGFDADWLQNHIANCPRCQRRIVSAGRVNLALSAMKSQPHKLDLLMRANAQAIGVLKHGLRRAPKAQKLRKMLPEPKLLERWGKYAHPAANAAACIAILLLMKIGVFSSMDKFQREGQKVVKQYYASHVGQEMADEIFTA